MISLKWVKSLKIFCGLENYAWITFIEPGFTYSACGQFTKYHEMIKNR